MQAQASTSNVVTTVVEPRPEGMDHSVFELSDGRLFVYRPIQPEDAHALQRFHRRLSPPLRLFAFLRPEPRV